ncbi:MAG: transporter substrate-binding domain-containing protein [Coriobacteriia bacterium]|nr:transporter substrate-binding domain-containing protein [Coriobacteriia bacterium]
MSLRKSSTSVALLLLSALLAFALVMAAGCSQGAKGSLTLPTPDLKSPTIHQDGILRVGVDTSNSTFAAKSDTDGQIIGIDVDVAAALAENLGLKLQIVDISGQDPAQALQDQQLDLVMGLNTDTELKSNLITIGPYLNNGIGVFSVGLGTQSGNFDPTSLNGLKIAAEAKTFSAWQVADIYGQAYVQTFNTLQEAFDQVVQGSITYAAADAVVGSVLAQNSTFTQKYQNIVCLGFLDSPSGYYMGVSPDNAALADAVTKAARSIRDSGVLNIVLSKWVGPATAQLIITQGAIVTGNPPGNSSSSSATDSADLITDTAAAIAGSSDATGAN